MFGRLGKTTNLKFKKNVAPLRRNALFFCLPVLLMALGGQTFKNTWFCNDPAGLSEKNVRTSATKC